MKHDNVRFIQKVCTEKSGADGEKTHGWFRLASHSKSDGCFFCRTMDSLDTHNLANSDSAKAQNEYSFLMGFTFCVVFCVFSRGKNLNGRVVWWTFSFSCSISFSVSRKNYQLCSVTLAEWLTSEEAIHHLFARHTFFCHIPSQTLCATFLIRRLQTLKNG